MRGALGFVPQLECLAVLPRIFRPLLKELFRGQLVLPFGSQLSTCALLSELAGIPGQNGGDLSFPPFSFLHCEDFVAHLGGKGFSIRLPQVGNFSAGKERGLKLNVRLFLLSYGPHHLMASLLARRQRRYAFSGAVVVIDRLIIFALRLW